MRERETLARKGERGNEGERQTDIGEWSSTVTVD